MAMLKMPIERYATSACSHSRDMNFFATVHVFFSDHSVGLRWFTACLVVFVFCNGLPNESCRCWKHFIQACRMLNAFESCLRCTCMRYENIGYRYYRHFAFQRDCERKMCSIGVLRLY